MVNLLLAIIYVSFVSLGLPDALLGAAWPVMQGEFGVPVSYAGGISLIIAVGTVVSSLQSDRMTKWIGTGRVMVISVAMTAIAMFGFSVTDTYWMLCLWAIPYGLGAGAVDASLNNYVAVHYASRHMSWLHCMWGLGASLGPYIMASALTGGMRWNTGYRIIALLQVVLTAVLLLSLPLWKKRPKQATPEEQDAPLTVRQILPIPGAKEVMIAFFCYCALEQTAILWGSSYLVLSKGMAEETAAGLASLFLLGLTAGRALNGFLTYKINDTNLIRLGQGIIGMGVLIMLLPLGEAASFAGLMLCGLGCAPIYPCVIHSTPAHFGEDKSQALVGIQMASAYMGVCVMPPLFGLLANHVGTFLLPWYLGTILLLMTLMCERLNKKTA
ncbi:MAG: MFS transporter [Faecousia sp.]